MRFLPPFAALLALLLISGCSGGKKAQTNELEIALFQGGYGIDFFEDAAKEFEKSHPGVKIDLWGNPRVWEQLRPRFVAGDPPDLTWPGWDLGYWDLIYEKQVLPVDKYLDTASSDGRGTWRDTLDPAFLSLGQWDGKSYLLPYFFSLFGWWYDKTLFDKNGWQPPKTWTELLKLCEEVKAKGIAPITHQGRYPGYLVNGMLMPFAQSVGGIEVVDAAQTMEPGAWGSPAMLKAAEMIAELRDKGFIDPRAIGLSHTEAQMDFVNGRAAMIPCGTWLYSETEKVRPPAVDLQFMRVPSVEGGVGDSTAIQVGIEPWVLPTKSKNPDLAMEFFKYITTLEKAKQFVARKGTLTIVKGSDQTKLPRHLESAAAAYRQSKTIWANQFGEWYKAFAKELEGAMAALISGDQTPKQFVERCEKAAEKTRQDPDFVKHKVERRG